MRRIPRREAMKQIGALAAATTFLEERAMGFEDTSAAFAWNHQYAQANGIRFHYVRHGAGFPVFLLHGWPGFWRTWRKNIPVLAEHFDVIAPDLRGFGDTEKPAGPVREVYGTQAVIDDIASLADALDIDAFGIVSHDIGAYVAQITARKYPHRVKGLFFFNVPYPGINLRWGTPGHVQEVWYQIFHQMPFAAELVGASRDTCEAYFTHFLRHWSHDPDTFGDDDIQAWIDNFMKPGNIQGGFNWYIAVGAARPPKQAPQPGQIPPIDIPTCVRWGANDKVDRIEWADNLPDYFSNLDFQPVANAGHFVHYEQSDFANQEITRFFKNLKLERLGDIK